MEFTDHQQQVVNAATSAADRAGKIILAGFQHPREDVHYKGSRDLVTKYDTDSQEAIKSTILSAFPHHKFLGEEDVAHGIAASAAALEQYKNEEHLWIVDPIDGTVNFANTMPLSVVLIAYASHGIVQFGLVHDPYRNETFTATRGKGAFLNGKPIYVSRTAEMATSLMATGSPPNLDSLGASLRALNLISSQVQSMRMLGSAGVHLSWLAAGRLTAYFEADLNSWDTAACSIIIEEAGGKVTDVWGNPYTIATRNIVATNGLVHDQLLQQLQAAKFWMGEQS